MASLLLVDAPGNRPALRAALASVCELTVVGDDGEPADPRIRHIALDDVRGETVLDVARRLGPVDGVLCWEQSRTHAANRTAAGLGLPLLWADPSRDLRDKRACYDAWSAHGVAHPRTVVVGAGGEIPDGPGVVKPAALQGGIGARLCADAGEAARAVEALTEALAGRGPDAWVGRAAARSDASQAILWQEVVRPDAGEDGARSEYSAEVVVAGGCPRLLAICAKAHVPPPHFAETTFAIPPTGPLPLPEPRIRGAVERAVTAAGLSNTVAHVEFCVSDGEVVFFELNPRLIGDPGPAVLEQVLDLRLASLLVDLATGARASALARARAALPTGRYAGFVDVRLTDAAGGRAYRGLDPAGEPLAGVEAHPVLTAGGEVRVSSLRGPARAATVQVAAATPEERDARLRHWSDPARLRPLGSRVPDAPATSSGELRVSLVDLADVLSGSAPDALDAWRRLVARASYAVSPPWAAVCAAMPGTVDARLVVVEDDEGVVAALPCWVCKPPPTGYQPEGLAGDALVLLGSRAGYRTELPLRPGLTDERRQEVATAVVAGASSFADERGVPEVWAMQADDETRALLEQVTDGRAVEQEPDTSVPLGKRSHGTWVATQPSRAVRQRLRREAERWDSSDRRLDVEPLTEVAAEGGALLAAHGRRLGGRATDDAMTRYLSLLADAFGDDAVAFTCRDRDGLVAFSAGLAWQDRLVMRVFGERGGVARRDGLYFYLSLHQPVRYAALSGRCWIDLGPTAYDAKLLRGAVLQRRWAVPIRTAGVS